MSYITYKVRVYESGTREWRLNGTLHREDGPACEYYDGSKYWWLNGKLHREDGPAVEDAVGDKFWFLDGKELTEKEFNARNETCEGKVVEINGKRYELKEL